MPGRLMLDRRTLLLTAGAAAAPLPAFAKVMAKRGTSPHERLICLDTHLDTPANLERPGWDIMARHAYADDLSQVDLPRMLAGGLDGGFWAIYTGQGPLTADGYAKARDAALYRGLLIRLMVAAHPQHFALALKAEDAASIAAVKKRIVYISIENSYPLGTDLTLLRTFYRIGVRMAGPVHTTNNQFADSATDKKSKVWNGLSPLGRDWLAQVNALGIVPDASHASDDVFDQMVEMSKSPVVLSHSGCRALSDHPRNLDDARIKKLAASGGVIQINSLSSYLVAVPANPARDTKRDAVFLTLRDVPTLSPAEARTRVSAAAKALAAIRAEYNDPRATFDDYIRQVRHALDLVGPEHVGFGADWDGGGGVSGMEDVSALPKITEALLKAGCSESDLGQMWSGNVLRLLRLAAQPK